MVDQSKRSVHWRGGVLLFPFPLYPSPPTISTIQVYASDAASMSAAMMGVRAAEGTDLEKDVVYK